MTKFYFESDYTPAAITPFAGALWTHTSLAYSKLSRTKANTPISAPSLLKGSGNNRELALFSSESLNAGNVGGTAQLAISAAQTVSSLSACLQVQIYLVSESGKTVRGILYAGQAPAGVSAVNTDPNYALAVGSDAAASRVRILNMNLTTVAAQQGDRIVVALGYWHGYTGSFDRRGLLFFGTPTTGDVSAVVDAADGTKAGWVDFSQNLSFEQEPLRVREITSLANSGAGSTITINYPATVKKNDLILAFQGGPGRTYVAPPGFTLLEYKYTSNGIMSHDAWSAAFYKSADVDGPFSIVYPIDPAISYAGVQSSVYRNATVAGSFSKSATGGADHDTPNITVPSARTQSKVVCFLGCGYSFSMSWTHGGRLLNTQNIGGEHTFRTVEHSYDWPSTSVEVPMHKHITNINDQGAHTCADIAVALAYSPTVVGNNKLNFKKPDSSWAKVKRIL